VSLTIHMHIIVVHSSSAHLFTFAIFRRPQEKEGRGKEKG